MIDWLVGWSSTCWIIDWLVDLMVYLVSWLAGWIIDWVVTDWWIGVYHGFVGCLIDQSVDQLNDWLVIKQLITINLLNEKNSDLYK